jgi:diaminopimelate epimerase
MRFQKGTALGNDYIVIDAADLPWEMTVPRARLLCDRHRGIGSDGILLGTLSSGSSGRAFTLRIINPDGSEAEKSGNGLRIFAAYLHGRGLVSDTRFEVVLPTDTVSMQVFGVTADGALDVEVAMGKASFPSPLDVTLNGGTVVTPTLVSVGNPHAVVFVDAFDRDDFLDRAPQLCTHPSFPNGTNVQFARVVDARTIEAIIWERGAGETMASGSSASAVAAAAVKTGKASPSTIEVIMRGGNAAVSISDSFDVTLRGPARMLYEGTLAQSLVKALAR